MILQLLLKKGEKIDVNKLLIVCELLFYVWLKGMGIEIIWFFYDILV